MRGDPLWITAKYHGKCSKCGTPFQRGDRVFYYPISRKIYAGDCAQRAADDFDTMREYERGQGVLYA